MKDGEFVVQVTLKTHWYCSIPSFLNNIKNSSEVDDKD